MEDNALAVAVADGFAKFLGFESGSEELQVVLVAIFLLVVLVLALLLVVLLIGGLGGAGLVWVETVIRSGQVAMGDMTVDNSQKIRAWNIDLAAYWLQGKIKFLPIEMAVALARGLFSKNKGDSLKPPDIFPESRVEPWVRLPGVLLYRDACLVNTNGDVDVAEWRRVAREGINDLKVGPEKWGGGALVGLFVYFLIVGLLEWSDFSFWHGEEYQTPRIALCAVAFLLSFAIPLEKFPLLCISMQLESGKLLKIRLPADAARLFLRWFDGYVPTWVARQSPVWLSDEIRFDKVQSVKAVECPKCGFTRVREGGVNFCEECGEELKVVGGLSDLKSGDQSRIHEEGIKSGLAVLGGNLMGNAVSQLVGSKEIIEGKGNPILVKVETDTEKSSDLGDKSIGGFEKIADTRKEASLSYRNTKSDLLNDFLMGKVMLWAVDDDDDDDDDGAK